MSRATTSTGCDKIRSENLRCAGRARLPEGRAAKPAGRNVLAAFKGLGITYTGDGLALDPLPPTQHIILAQLDIPALARTAG